MHEKIQCVCVIYPDPKDPKPKKAPWLITCLNALIDCKASAQKHCVKASVAHSGIAALKLFYDQQGIFN